VVNHVRLGVSVDPIGRTSIGKERQASVMYRIGDFERHERA
jgi:hypothetical protein